MGRRGYPGCSALEEAMEGVDAVIHSAAIVSFSKKEQAEMYKVNVEGTANVVNIALEKNVRRFVHISSVAALGRKPMALMSAKRKNGKKARSIPITQKANTKQSLKYGVGSAKA